MILLNTKELFSYVSDGKNELCALDGCEFSIWIGFLFLVYEIKHGVPLAESDEREASNYVSPWFSTW